MRSIYNRGGVSSGLYRKSVSTILITKFKIMHQVTSDLAPAVEDLFAPPVFGNMGAFLVVALRAWRREGSTSKRHAKSSEPPLPR